MKNKVGRPKRDRTGINIFKIHDYLGAIHYGFRKKFNKSTTDRTIVGEIGFDRKYYYLNNGTQKETTIDFARTIEIRFGLELCKVISNDLINYLNNEFGNKFGTRLEIDNLKLKGVNNKEKKAEELGLFSYINIKQNGDNRN